MDYGRCIGFFILSPVLSHAAPVDLSGFNVIGAFGITRDSNSIYAIGSQVEISGSVVNLLSFDYFLNTAGDVATLDLDNTGEQIALVSSGNSTRGGTYVFLQPFTGNLQLSVASSGEVTVGINNLTAQNPVPAVPEPETYAMLPAGLGMTGWVARRRQGLRPAGAIRAATVAEIC